MIVDQYPSFWRLSPETVAIWEALGSETAALRADLKDLLDQCNVQTATWGLDLWEQKLGLPTEAEKDLDYRRSRIISKLRGTGTVTVAMVQNVAESYVNGEVEIIENPAEYHFDVKFVGVRGIPPNMDDLTEALEEIKPAHLTYAYVYTYNTYGDLSEHTYGQLSAYTHQELREEKLA